MLSLMAVRVGIDLVAVDGVRESLDARAERYLSRVYTEREVADCTGPHGLQPERLAARFAAKEATRKVLRSGEGFAWTSIELLREPSGWPRLELSGRAAELAEAAGIAGLEVSLTHEAGFASAVVIAEIPPSDR